MPSTDCADCGQTTTHPVRGLCRRCYHKHYQLGTHTQYAPTKTPRPRQTCHCGKPVYARKLCHLHYDDLQRRHTAYGRWESTLVDATPVREHAQALRDAGFSIVRIAELAHTSDKTISGLFTGRQGKRGDGPTKRCNRDIAARILAITIPAKPHELLSDGHAVDNTGTIRRLQALQAIGHNLTEISRRLGRQPRNLGRIFRANQCTATTARAVEALYNELSMTPGPDQRAINRATRRGWAPPLAWDDDTIDNPDASPDAGTTTRRGDSDIDELERLVSFGERPIDAMRRVGWANWNSVNVAYRRARDTTPPWCKNGHPRLDRTDLAFCPDCLATHYEKKAAS